jgi:FixJ family two-component response regulator
LTQGTVYIVDRDSAIRDSMHWLLTGNGYKVLCFDSAEDFLKLLDPAEPACLLVDTELSGMSGMDLIHQIADLELPIQSALMSTSNGAIKAFDYSIDLLIKPFNTNLLLATVKKLSARIQVGTSTELTQ